MRLTPPEPENLEKGFTAENDLFVYRLFAERLSNLVQNIEEPLVIALDGPWGSGKSVFVKQWAGLLRGRGAHVIQFDAFGNDHFEDAFLALSAEIYAAAKQTLGGEASPTSRFFQAAQRGATALLPILGQVAIRAATAGAMNSEDIEKVGGAAVKAFGDEAAKVVGERLRQASDERAGLEEFRNVLSELADKLASNKAEERQNNKVDEEQTEEKPFPLIFIIDELDRCRPPFALSIIERVKHMFSVPGVCFVFVTHLDQLEQTVQGAYGTTFDAHTYLEKFYHLRVMLPDTKLDGGQRARYVSYLWDALGITFPDDMESENVKGFLTVMAEDHALSLRQLERVMTNLVLVHASVVPVVPVVPVVSFIPQLVVGLCIMRQINPALYEKARKKALTWEEAQAWLGESFDLSWWRYALGAMSEKEERDYSQEYAHKLPQQGAPQNLIPLMTEHIDALVHGEKSLQEVVLENAGARWGSSQ